MIKSFLNYFTKQPEKNVIDISYRHNEHVSDIPDREIVNEIIKIQISKKELFTR